MSAQEKTSWPDILDDFFQNNQTCQVFDVAISHLSPDHQKLITRTKDIASSSWTSLQFGTNNGAPPLKGSPFEIDAKHYKLSVSLALYLLTGTPGEYSSVPELIRNCEEYGVLQPGELTEPTIN